jgi:hypothetical protein
MSLSTETTSQSFKDHFQSILQRPFLLLSSGFLFLIGYQNIEMFIISMSTVSLIFFLFKNKNRSLTVFGIQFTIGSILSKFLILIHLFSRINDITNGITEFLEDSIQPILIVVISSLIDIATLSTFYEKFKSSYDGKLKSIFNLKQISLLVIKALSICGFIHILNIITEAIPVQKYIPEFLIKLLSFPLKFISGIGLVKYFLFKDKKQSNNTIVEGLDDISEEEIFHTPELSDSFHTAESNQDPN